MTFFFRTLKMVFCRGRAPSTTNDKGMSNNIGSSCEQASVHSYVSKKTHTASTINPNSNYSSDGYLDPQSSSVPVLKSLLLTTGASGFNYENVQPHLLV